MPIDEINELRDCFIQQLSPVRVYLFGSYADGTFHEDSDFDFYIVVDDRETDLIELMRQAYKSVRSVKKRPVDILIGTSSKFEERKNQLTVENEVYQKGVLLYAA